ncbi:ABC-type transport auxiliary lipoprotein family protein [Rhodocyclaceae bacterium]
MRILTIFLSVLLLAGCVGNPPRQNDIALYDLGQVPAAVTPLQLPIAALNVAPSPWIDSPAQLYRLNFADDLRRRAYVESRWVAPPAELLKRHLQGQLVGVSGCRLELALDELEQQFESAQKSHVKLELRAALLARHGEDALARKTFRLQGDAPSADARGSVQGTRAALQGVTVELIDWLNGLAKARPELCQRKE